MKNKKSSLLCRFCYCTPLYQVSFSYLQYWRVYGGGAICAPPVLQGSKKPGINRVKSSLSSLAKKLKTCPEKIENKSYHHRRILKPILEDGNVNKVCFEMTFKRSESLCLVLKPLKDEQKACTLFCFRCIIHLLAVLSPFLF